MTGNKRAPLDVRTGERIQSKGKAARFFPDEGMDAARRLSQLEALRGTHPPLSVRLTGLPAHDVGAWGELFSETGDELVRVADLVRLVQRRSGLQAVRSVSETVLDVIEADGSCPFFQLQPGRFAFRIEADAWLMPASYPGRVYDAVNGGLVGTVEALRWHWARVAKSTADLDQGDHAAVAIRMIDAVRLFERSAASSASPALVVPLQLVGEARTAGPTRDDRIHGASEAIRQPDRNGKGQVDWSSARTCRAFVRAYDALQEAGAKTDEALQVIADRWGCGKGSSLRKRITPCRDSVKGDTVARPSAAG